eukprot:m.202203 g.202203  ORF g.202203 m.202203 type:complete len:102 (-) comp14976_c2_seq1:456-761(-)
MIHYMVGFGCWSSGDTVHVMPVKDMDDAAQTMVCIAKARNPDTLQAIGAALEAQYPPLRIDAATLLRELPLTQHEVGVVQDVFGSLRGLALATRQDLQSVG